MQVVTLTHLELLNITAMNLPNSLRKDNRNRKWRTSDVNEDAWQKVFVNRLSLQRQST